MTKKEEIFISDNVLKDLNIVMTREEWRELCEKSGSKMLYPYAEIIQFPKSRK